MRLLFLVPLFACSDPGEPLVEAHQGAAGYYPQNSRLAMFQSIDDGYDAIELDLVLTADGVPVLSHDPWVHTELCRRTDGSLLTERLRISSFTLDELQQGFRCGHIPDPAFPNAAVQAASIMAFDELVQRLYLDRPEVLLHLDLKYEPGWTGPPGPFAAEVLDRWADADLPQRFYVSSSFPDMVEAVEVWSHENAWDVTTSLLWPPRRREQDTADLIGFELGSTTGTRTAVAAALNAGADGLALPWEFATRQQVREARQAGLSVQLWTLNTPALLREHSRWPVDILITDYPGDRP